MKRENKGRKQAFKGGKHALFPKENTTYKQKVSHDGRTSKNDY